MPVLPSVLMKQQGLHGRISCKLIFGIFTKALLYVPTWFKIGQMKRRNGMKSCLFYGLSVWLVCRSKIHTVLYEEISEKITEYREWLIVKYRCPNFKRHTANNISIIFGSKFGTKKINLAICVKILNAFLEVYTSVISISHSTCNVQYLSSTFKQPVLTFWHLSFTFKF